MDEDRGKNSWFDSDDSLNIKEIINIPKRRLVLIGDIDDTKLTQILLAMDIFEQKSRSKPITLIMSSSGGDVYAGFGIYDRIKLSPCPITVEAWGPCMSMATIILQAADKRLIAPTARFMIHRGSMRVQGNKNDVHSWMEFDRKVDEPLCEKIYLDRIKKKIPSFTKERLKKLLDTDTFMQPHEVVEYGLADSIMTSRKEKRGKK